ncbi:rhamnogalacturonan lyase [Cellulomonas sp. 179-A 4D5 NHS]|uniref:rhamnogalacturonan lyase n=1 Tax=Cellulomonas sp. 179-A 4D5 NHS TaxID=3142378 RepID=UPI0039A32112
MSLHASAARAATSGDPATRAGRPTGRPAARPTGPGRRVRAAAVVAAALVLALVTPGGAAAQDGYGHGGGRPGGPGPQLERLDRGLAAAVTPDGVFLSWRLLAHESRGDAAVSGFHVYRDDALVATVSGSTNHLDTEGTETSVYRVAAVVGGVEVDPGTSVAPWSQAWVDLPLTRPADGVTPTGETYTYAANDVSVGDVDGDGQYEYVVKWDPSNSKDVSIKGYTGPVYVDTYELDGTLLHRLDLGVNVRAGAHYTQFLVYDLDGDARAEIMLKTAPGTRTVRYADGAPVEEAYVTLPRADVRAGVRHDDDYRLSAAGYREHVVEMFEGWSAHPEVVAGRWPATLEEAFGIPVAYAYPLSRADAEALADHFLDVYAPSRSARNVLRAFEGFVVDGPEYLTVFDGATGAELDTVRYEPGRHDDGLMWGDYALPRIEPANRSDRFLAGVAYLDGSRPSAVFARGYYTRSTVAAYRWDGRSIRRQWLVDSGWTPMTNPFRDTPHGRDGTDPRFGSITTQGFHSLSAADVDGDGRQEIVYGAATIDDDGSLLYSSADVLPPGSAAPGTVVRLGHGDAMHVTDIDPQRPGLEVFTVHENGVGAPYGYAMRDAATGEVLFGAYTGRDTGRGMVGDVVPSEPGLEAWATDLRSADGDLLDTAVPGTNQSIRWAADMTTQVVEGAGDVTPTITDRGRGVLLTAEGTRTNNGTKGNPSLVADVLGDWREELLVRTVDSSAIRIHLATEITDRALHTLMHDVQYRAEVARQQTTYNQPSYPGFLLASDTDVTAVPVPDLWAPGATGALAATLDGYVASGDVSRAAARPLAAALRRAERLEDAGRPRAAAAEVRHVVERLGGYGPVSGVSASARAVLHHQATAVAAMLD